MSWATIARSVVDGRDVIIKRTSYVAALEVDGLRALAEAGMPVPEVIWHDESQIVMSQLSGPSDWEHLGRSLAACHRTTAEEFGYHRDNVIGPLDQANSWSPSWPDFYMSRRLEPLGDALPAGLWARIRDAHETGRLVGLLEHDQPPSLIHGDLWSGNIVAGAGVIDPAVHFADRELDPAFAAVFGGIPHRMWEAYEEVWPLDEGWEERRPALQLYHLLVHVRVFGGTYVNMVAERLDDLGW